MRTAFTKATLWLTAAMVLCGSLTTPAFVHAHSAEITSDHTHDSTNHHRHDHGSSAERSQSRGSKSVGLKPSSHCHFSLVGVDFSLPVNGSDSPIPSAGENADALLGCGRVTPDISVSDFASTTLSTLLAALISVRRFTISPSETDDGTFAICDCLRSLPSASARLARFGLLQV